LMSTTLSWKQHWYRFLLLEGSKSSCTSSSIRSWPSFKHLGQGPMLHKWSFANFVSKLNGS
jgi:hypothetical protein